MRTKPMNPTNMTTVQVDFEVVDSKGRMIGSRITTWECDFVECPDGSGWYSNIAPGHYYQYEPHATRDGVTYGAMQGSKMFTTEAERAQAIARYLLGARRRATPGKR